MLLSAHSSLGLLRKVEGKSLEVQESGLVPFDEVLHPGCHETFPSLYSSWLWGLNTGSSTCWPSTLPQSCSCAQSPLLRPQLRKGTGCKAEGCLASFSAPIEISPQLLGCARKKPTETETNIQTIYMLQNDTSMTPLEGALRICRHVVSLEENNTGNQRGNFLPHDSYSWHSLAFSLYSFPLLCCIAFFFSFQREKILLEKAGPSWRMSCNSGQTQQSQHFPVENDSIWKAGGHSIATAGTLQRQVLSCLLSNSLIYSHISKHSPVSHISLCPEVSE